MLNQYSIREAIKEFDLSPAKSLGQNFLLDQNLTNKIARAAGDLTNFHIIEIGPGPGGLTKSLLDLGAKHVTALEKDIRCIKLLEKLASFYPGRLTIINIDALDFKEQDYIKDQTKIIANLPYNIGTKLLLKWLDNIELFHSLTLMFQKEVADRIISKPNSKKYGRISVISQWLCQVKHHFDLPPSAFFPPPKIFSSVISLTPHDKNTRIPAIKHKVEKITMASFSQRRKTLKASLKSLFNDPIAILTSLNIDPMKRPENLTIAEFIALSEKI